jgi:squalene synthase HpnC
VPVETRDLKRTPRLDSRSGEEEGAPVVELRPRLDQDAQRRRVHELDLAEVDHDPLRRFGASAGQGGPDTFGVIEIELAAQADDAGGSDCLDPQNGIPAQSVSGRVVRHDNALLDSTSAAGGSGRPRPRRIRHLPNPKRKRHLLTSRLPQGILYGMDVAAVARRARTENFPVASVLFPRRLRPHLRAIYGFARLVDILGDEVEGDRLAALGELERELEACYRSEPTWPVMRALAPTIHEFSLPREPFLRLIEANRMDQRVSEYVTWEDLREYCRHSADPVGRLVLGLLRLDGDLELVAASDDVCTGLQLVNFLQDVPRDLELGRIYLPLEDRRRFGVTALDHPSPELVDLLRFEAARARDLLAAGQLLQERIGGRTGRAVGLFARGGAAALDALESAHWDVFTQRPRPSRTRLALAALAR